MKRILTYSLGVVGVATVGLLAVAPSFAGAQTAETARYGQGKGYGYTQMLETKAKLVNMSTDELKAQLETKTMLQVAEENGVSQEQLQEASKIAAQARWVERGFSEEEIQERLQSMEERQQDGECDGSGGGMQRHGQNR